MSEEVEQLVEQPEPAAAEAPVAEAPAGRRASRTAIRKSRAGLWLPPVVAFFVVAIVWDLYAAHHKYVLPTIGAMWDSLRDNPAMYWHDFLTTLSEVAIGAGCGIVIGFLLAIVMAQVRILERALMPLMVTMMVTPIVAIAPALVIAFGFGSTPKYLVTGIVVFFPVLVNTLTGLRDVDGRTLDVLKTLHVSRWEMFWHLELPGSLPFLFAGLRIAMPLAVVGATIAEIAAAGESSGLGSLVSTASNQGNLALAWTAIVLLCLLGILLTAVLALIRSRVLWWDNEAAGTRSR
jgi:NitT/TauT family transport system permease protein